MGAEPGIDLFLEPCWFIGSPEGVGECGRAECSLFLEVLPCWSRCSGKGEQSWDTAGFGAAGPGMVMRPRGGEPAFPELLPYFMVLLLLLFRQLWQGLAVCFIFHYSDSGLQMIFTR